MHRRDFLRRGAMAFSAALTPALPTVVADSPDSNPGPDRPNILWITCEDLSPHLGCYGDHTVPTPNLDRLARQGIRYTHAFATTGVCAPSRHALITGMYPTSTYALHMRNHTRTSALKEIEDPATRQFAANRPLYEAVPPPHVRCLTEYLRLAGYYCTNNSKQDYQFLAPVTAWDESSRRAHWRNRRPGQPFFSVFNFTVTHESGVFGNGRSPKVTDPDAVTVPPYYPDTPVVRADLAKHYDNIAALDQQVGRLLADLEADGLLDKTIIFFFSDHGDGLPRSKRWVYDSGTRVPLVIRFPDKRRAGTRSDRLVSFVDFMPTVLSLAGVPVPDPIHGIPFLGDQAGPPRQYVYLHRDRNGENRETIRAVRDHRFRYVRNFRPNEPYFKPLSYRDRQAISRELSNAVAAGSLGPNQWQFTAPAKPLEEFYDTQADPYEIHNLAGDPRYLADIARMREALDAWIAACNDPLDMPEDQLVRTRVYPPDGRQPTTAEPQARLAPAGAGEYQLTIACPTPGACIGYRLQSKQNDAKRPWTVYTRPVVIDGDTPIEIIAHRIGFKPAAPIVVRPPR